MAFKQPLPQPSSSHPHSYQRQKKNPSTTGLCRICGEQARIVNYGLFSCQSCKTFFRRNGFRATNVRPCSFNQRCEVTIRTRHSCTACRLAKCLLLGMSPELIRKEEIKPSKHSSSTGHGRAIASKRKGWISAFPATHLLPDGRKSNFSSDWTLLSNIVHAYDRFSVTIEVRHTVDLCVASKSALPFDTRSALKTIHSLFMSMYSFIQSSPDFRLLTFNEQISLIHRNLYGVVSLYFIIVFRDSTMINHVKCLERFLNIYGSEMIFLTKSLCDRLDFDSTFLDTMLMILALSSNCHVGNRYESKTEENVAFDTRHLFIAQNVYVEVLWDYLICRYGHHQPIRRWAQLIGIFLRLLENAEWNYINNRVHHELVNECLEDIVHLLMMNHNQNVAFWGQDDS